MNTAWPARFGVTLEGRETLAEIPALAQAAEAAGAGTFWVASHLYLRDPITIAHVALQATQRIRVALMAMSPYAMHPVHLAMAAAALAELHPGRVVLCLGAGAPADREAAVVIVQQAHVVENSVHVLASVGGARAADGGPVLGGAVGHRGV